ncbi:oligosaccharide flippase family protein [Lutibacter maritimus]|uniref:Membrane protein involved in the export of O-antigen and teichoic acid n=1 Tax=Lutibacter maritimus TaxID=593133 RepID=A0A1I6QME4_9FLAO|nr:oligosaccharide flippase family protein [Lutibacter maritimus]SFS53625.1 Membrane protein involved in the export of O-antigen and teichoic acid [Lutibacter maritimus]
MNLLRKKQIFHFFENVVSLFSLKSIDLALAIFLIPFLIYKVGVQNYGLYAFALSLVLFFVNIANYGFNLAAVRELSKKPKTTKNISKVFNEVFSVKVYVTCVLYLILVFLILLVPKFQSHKLLFGLASLLLISDVFSIRWFFLGIEKMKFLPVISLVATLIYVLLVVIFIQQPKHYTYIILFEFIGLLIANGISFFYIVLEYAIEIKIISVKKAYNYLYANFSSFINLLIPSILSNTAVFLVGLFSIPTHVSIMQLGVKISNAFSTVNTILSQVFYAMVNRRIHKIKLSFAVLMGVGLVLSVVMFVSADYIIKHWVKIEDTHILNDIIFIIKILSPTPLLMAIISAFGVNGLLVFNKDQILSKITLIATGIGLIIGFVLVVQYTFIGGALFLLMVRGIIALFSFVFFNKEVKLKELKQLNN